MLQMMIYLLQSPGTQFCLEMLVQMKQFLCCLVEGEQSSCLHLLGKGSFRRKKFHTLSLKTPLCTDKKKNSKHFGIIQMVFQKKRRI